jgi:hypothetical protein
MVTVLKGKISLVVEGDSVAKTVVCVGNYVHYQHFLTYFVIVIFFKAQAKKKAFPCLYVDLRVSEKYLKITANRKNSLCTP